jgi:hypothetical protein
MCHPKDMSLSRANVHVVESTAKERMWRKEPPQDIYNSIGRQQGSLDKAFMSTLNHACTRIDDIPIKALLFGAGNMVSILEDCLHLVTLNQKQTLTGIPYFRPL